ITATRQQLPLHEARVSFIDGAGAQMMMLSWQRPDGLLKGVNVLYHDQWGIKDCYGTDEMEVGQWTELVSDTEEQGFISFRVSLDYSRALIAEARALNKRTRRKLPIAYSIWRSLIEGEEALKKPSVSTMLESRPFTSELAPLVQRGNELYQLPEFASWMFDSLVDLLPYINRYWSIDNVFDMLTIGSCQFVSKRKKGKSKKQQANMDALVSEALEALVDEKWRTLYEARLRRQGALFRFSKRDEDAELTSAVASALHPDSAIPVRDQPFLCTMMQRSIESGPARLMAEMIEGGGFADAPISLDPFFS